MGRPSSYAESEEASIDEYYRSCASVKATIVKKLTRTMPYRIPGSVGLPTLTLAICRSHYPNPQRFQEFTSGIRLALVTSNDEAREPRYKEKSWHL
jgi:hypothetical protein